MVAPQGIRPFPLPGAGSPGPPLRRCRCAGARSPPRPSPVPRGSAPDPAPQTPAGLSIARPAFEDRVRAAPGERAKGGEGQAPRSG
ncbi:hypothetical protein EF910_23940 [Streptomyces sp. WAC07149]|nr:hypothetical protein EF910_23940 [Streptomyces sp. WAC07149]